MCPFCALLCDDVGVKTGDDGISLVGNNCPKAKREYARARHEATAPSVRDPASNKHQAVKPKDAISEFSALLKMARRPYFGGLGTDLDALRAIHELGGRCGAIVDPMGSETALANIGVMQTVGWYATTLSEVRNRADFVLIVGADCRNRYPRFVERTLEPSSALATTARKRRRVCYLGPRKNAPRSSKKIRIENIYCEAEEIAPLLSVLRAQVLDKPLVNKLSHSAKLADVASALKQAEYATVAFSAADFATTQARLCIESISKMVADLNPETRAAALSLGGDDGGMSAMQVSAWRSGYPLRVSYAEGVPTYDPNRFRLENLLDTNSVDCLVWVDAFGHSTPPSRTDDRPLVFVGHPQLAERLDADVVIPVGLPGIHHKARLVRTDSVVTMPLDRVYSSRLPSVKKVFDDVIATLTNEEV